MLFVSLILIILIAILVYNIHRSSHQQLRTELAIHSSIHSSIHPRGCCTHHVVLPAYPPSQPPRTPPTDGQRHDRLLDDLGVLTHHPNPHFRDAVQQQYRVEMSDVFSLNPLLPPSDNVDLLNLLTSAACVALTYGWTCHVVPCMGPYWFHVGDNIFQLPIPYHHSLLISTPPQPLPRRHCLSQHSRGSAATPTSVPSSCLSPTPASCLSPAPATSCTTATVSYTHTAAFTAAPLIRTTTVLITRNIAVSCTNAVPYTGTILLNECSASP
jgi:hypothetical protein